MSAVRPQMSAAPQPPRSSTDQPSEPSMNPGFARQMTNPSYQRSVFRSWRSSTTASAMPYLLFVRDASSGRAGERNTLFRHFQWARRVGLQSARGPATDHDHVRVRRGEAGAVRRALGVRLRTFVEHAADSGRGVRRSAPAHAAPQARGTRGFGDRACRVRSARRHEPTLLPSSPARDDGLAVRAPAVLETPLPAHGERRTTLATPPRIAC